MKNCLIDGCQKDEFCKGVCEYHYRKSRLAFRSKCSVEGCGQPSLARGLCNNHYTQYRQKEVGSGKWDPHVVPVCSVIGCGGKHLAHGLCQKHYSEEIRRVNREFLTARYFKNGVICKKCGKSFDMVQMDAHHSDPLKKEHILSEVLNNSALQRRPELLVELDECEMLCARCHQNTHYDPLISHEETYQRKDKGRRIDGMKVTIREKFGEKCSKCGEWLYPKEMEFHHRDRLVKVDNISDMMRFASLDEVLAEVEKCDIVCRNCHRIAA